MRTERIAVVSEVAQLTVAEMTPVVAALQQQIDQDFSAFWDVRADLSIIAPDRQPAAGAWTLRIQEHVDGQLGFHHDDHGRPGAVIEYSETWSLTASHELLEMLVDPLGNRILPGPSPRGDGTTVYFLVEACDPCQVHTYTIANVPVSDFLTPAYYDPTASAEDQRSFKRSVSSPFELPRGGYISWQTTASPNMMQQAHWPADGEVQYREIGPVPDLVTGRQRLRQWVDGETLRLGMPGSPHAHPTG